MVRVPHHDTHSPWRPLLISEHVVGDNFRKTGTFHILQVFSPFPEMTCRLGRTINPIKQTNEPMN